MLPELAGLHVAETTVPRATEGAGERVADHRRRGRTTGFPRAGEWHRDAQGRTGASISLDLTGVRQQAQDGGAADGRMPYVAMVYNPVPELPEGCPQQRRPKHLLRQLKRRLPLLRAPPSKRLARPTRPTRHEIQFALVRQGGGRRRTVSFKRAGSVSDRRSLVS